MSYAHGLFIHIIDDDGRRSEKAAEHIIPRAYTSAFEVGENARARYARFAILNAEDVQVFASDEVDVPKGLA